MERDAKITVTPPSLLQQEIGKKRPFELLEQEAMLNLMRTADRLELEFSRLFRGYELTASQYNILRILRGEGKPLPILEIASRMLTAVPGITGLIDRLEKAKLVRRQRCEDDRRVVYVAIETEGLEVLKQLDEPEHELHRKLLGHLTTEQLQMLISLLERARTPADPRM